MLTSSPQEEMVAHSANPAAVDDKGGESAVAASASSAPPPPVSALVLAAEPPTASVSPRKFLPLVTIAKLTLRKPGGAAGGTAAEPGPDVSHNLRCNGERDDATRRPMSIILKAMRTSVAPSAAATLVDVDEEETNAAPPAAPSRHLPKSQCVPKRFPTTGVFATRAGRSNGTTERSRSEVNSDMALQHLRGAILQVYDPHCALSWFFDGVASDGLTEERIRHCAGDRTAALRGLFLHADSDDHWEAARGRVLDIHRKFLWWRHCYWTVARGAAMRNPSETAVLDAIFRASIGIQRLLDIESEAFGVRRATAECGAEADVVYYPFALKPDRRDWLHAVDLGWKSSSSQIFRFPVDLQQYPIYAVQLAKFDAKPMALSDLFDRIRCGDSSAELETAMKQIKTNCFIFNGEASEHSRACKLLLSCMDRALRSHSPNLSATQSELSSSLPLMSEHQRHKRQAEDLFSEQLAALAKTTVLPKRLQSVVDDGTVPGATAAMIPPLLPRKRGRGGRNPKQVALNVRAAKDEAEKTDLWVQCDSCEKWHVVSENAFKKHSVSERTTCMDIASELCSPTALEAVAKASAMQGENKFASKARHVSTREVVDVDLPSPPVPSATDGDAHRRNGKQSRGRKAHAAARGGVRSETKKPKRSRSSSSSSSGSSSLPIAEAHRRNGRHTNVRGRAVTRGRAAKKETRRAKSSSSSQSSSAPSSSEESSLVPSPPPRSRSRSSAQRAEKARRGRITQDVQGRQVGNTAAEVDSRRHGASDITTAAAGAPGAASRADAPHSAEEVKMHNMVMSSLLQVGLLGNSAESSSLFPANPFALLSLEALQREYRKFQAFEQELKKFVKPRAK